MRNLNDIMNAVGSDKGDQIGAKHNYAVLYDKFLSMYRANPINFVEIGIDRGQSTKGWYEYFEKAAVNMVDINDFSSYLNNDRIKCHAGNQSVFTDMERIAKSIGSINVLIDDGGHCMDHQQITFGAMFPFIVSGGLFFIEDILTSNYDPTVPSLSTPNGFCYGQPLLINKDKSNTTIRVFKNWQLTGVFKSDFLSPEKNIELTDQIKDVVIYDDKNNKVDIMSSDENKILDGGVICIVRK